jgi:succinate dehydrogenase / fumarate reductase cytochrome b subunit
MAKTMAPQAVTRREAAPIRRPRRGGPPIVAFYRSAVGKKWVMAITGVALMGFVLFHLIGNLKLFLSKEELNLYGEALRDIPGHLLPRTVLLWTFRIGLIAAFVLHIHAAAALTVLNRRARPDTYKSPRDYIAADFASRTMRWTGVIVALYVLFHLMDLTWGNANPEFVRGDPYNNLVYSMERVPVAIVYVVATIALAIHLYHGSWSLFQSLGLNNPRYNAARRTFAQLFAGIILVGNLSFPIAVQLGFVETACPHTDPVAECEEDSGV